MAKKHSGGWSEAEAAFKDYQEKEAGEPEWHDSVEELYNDSRPSCDDMPEGKEGEAHSKSGGRAEEEKH
jgi:hypothetical protein